MIGRSFDLGTPKEVLFFHFPSHLMHLMVGSSSHPTCLDFRNKTTMIKEHEEILRQHLTIVLKGKSFKSILS